MDKYTQFANKILSETLAPLEEYGPVMSSSEDFEFTPGSKPKNMKRMKKYKVVSDKEKKAKNEDGETLDADDLKTLETVKALAGGKAKGGMNPFNNPEKEIQKAYGKMLSNVSKKINKVAKKI